MGCIFSKSSTDHDQQPPSHTVVIIPNHKIHDHPLITRLKTNDTVERCSSFHTVEEYDALLQRITKQNDAELAGVPAHKTVTDSSCEKDGNFDTSDHDEKFQTVASLRQWLHAPSGGDAAIAADYSTPKSGFSFYEKESDNNTQVGAEENSVLVKKSGKQEEGENIVELVAAFDKYMQQLQIDEENILKQIHNIIN